MMKLPRLEGMPSFIQSMIEEEPKKVVYVRKKRFSFFGLIIKLLIGLIAIIVIISYFPDIIKIFGGVI